MARRAWIEPPPAPAGLPRLHDDPLLHRVLATREFSPAAAADFLDPRPRPLPDPSRLPGMDAAADRIAGALRAGERIAVFGDYDADGVTSTAILTLALRRASGGKAPAAVALPRREQGYGLNPEAVQAFAADGATLLIAVDCGSGDTEHVRIARDLGMEVVAIDHHELPGGAAFGALVASARLEHEAPYRDLAAAGLALLAAFALAQRGFDVGDGPGAEPRSLLDLAMIGTVGDVSRLTGDNRALVRDGLRAARAKPRWGLRALVGALGLDPAALDSRQVARQIAPTLNAPGRKDDPWPALDLLLAEDPLTANRWVAEALAARAWVRTERAALVARVMEALRREPDVASRSLVVVALDECPPGLAGLAATELTHQLQRPAVVLARDGDGYKGSARSIDGFDIGAALRGAGGLLRHSGGHRQAAGLSVAAENVEALREALDATARAGGVPAPPGIRLDAELPADRLDLDTVKLLDALRPFGPDNEPPLLLVRGAPVREVRTMGDGGRHLKIVVGGPAARAAAILWNEGERARELAPGMRIDLAGRLERNTWNGRTEPQLVLEDFRPAEKARSPRDRAHPS